VQRIKKLENASASPLTRRLLRLLEEILQDLDQVLVMTVNPGFGHQHFLHTVLPKITRARQMIDRIIPFSCDLEVDGAVDATTLPWRLPQELTCWWLDQRFSMTAKASPPP